LGQTNGRGIIFLGLRGSCAGKGPKVYLGSKHTRRTGKNSFRTMEKRKWCTTSGQSTIPTKSHGLGSGGKEHSWKWKSMKGGRSKENVQEKKDKGYLGRGKPPHDVGIRKNCIKFESLKKRSLKNPNEKIQNGSSGSPGGVREAKRWVPQPVSMTVQQEKNADNGTEKERGWGGVKNEGKTK